MPLPSSYEQAVFHICAMDTLGDRCVIFFLSENRIMGIRESVVKSSSISLALPCGKSRHCFQWWSAGSNQSWCSWPSWGAGFQKGFLSLAL